MDTQSTVSGTYRLDEVGSGATFDGNISGVSWGAVLAGAAAAAALSLVLFILGVGFGLSAVSPWSYNTVPMGKSTIIWLAFTQLAAAGIGGYMAGRLRVKWVSVHTEEVYFRDTAHGLLAWAVATLVTAVFLTGALRAVTSGAVNVAAATSTATAAGTVSYFSDMLLRADPATPVPNNANAAPGNTPSSNTTGGDTPASSNTTGMTASANTPTGTSTPAMAMSGFENAALRAEVARIFTNDLATGSLAADDEHYLSRVVAQHTGLSQADADKRVENVYARLNKVQSDTVATAKVAAAKASKVAAYTALWMFVALLLGAFFASLMATFGGKQRDRLYDVVQREGTPSVLRR